MDPPFILLGDGESVCPIYHARHPHTKNSTQRTEGRWDQLALPAAGCQASQGTPAELAVGSLALRPSAFHLGAPMTLFQSHLILILHRGLLQRVNKIMYLIAVFNLESVYKYKLLQLPL